MISIFKYKVNNYYIVTKEIITYYNLRGRE